MFCTHVMALPNPTTYPLLLLTKPPQILKLLLNWNSLPKIWSPLLRRQRRVQSRNVLPKGDVVRLRKIISFSILFFHYSAGYIFWIFKNTFNVTFYIWKTNFNYTALSKKIITFFIQGKAMPAIEKRRGGLSLFIKPRVQPRVRSRVQPRVHLPKPTLRRMRIQRKSN